MRVEDTCLGGKEVGDESVIATEIKIMRFTH